MNPISILHSLSRISPGTLLDIGCRDLTIAERFFDLGYSIHAIDPVPPKNFKSKERFFVETTKLEDFKSQNRFDLVIASLVSHLVTYDLYAYLSRLKVLTKHDGLFYVTLIGDDDEWASLPNAKAINFMDACGLIKDLELSPIYKSTEWFEGCLYSGEPKFWHLHKFVLQQI